MNIIINGFSEEVHSPIILNILDTFKVNYCQMIYNNYEINTSPVETIFHSAAKITQGDYGVDWNELKPLDEELIESMSGCEQIVLKMMDRVLIPLYSDRKRLYLKHLRYWNHVINNKKIDLFLSSSPPHEVYDYVIYSLCKLKNIPTISLFQIMASDVVIIMDDWEKIIPEIKEKYQQLLDYFKSTPESEIQLSGGLKNEFDYLSSKNQSPHYMSFKRPARSIIDSLARKIFSLKISRFIFLAKKPSLLLIKTASNIKNIVNNKFLFNFYNKHTTKPNIKNKYIYFPLHMQPEATTSPLAGAFVDQILIVQMIASFLPKDVYLYVKEHPFQTYLARDIEFYKELLIIPQVRLVPMSYNTFDLINNSMAVATATGTAGWEALFKGKPVLLFGHCFYQYAKGVFMIRTNNDCKKAFNEIINDNLKVSSKELKIYLKSLEDYTIEGYIDLFYKSVSQLTDSISNKNIIDKITDKIKSIGL